MELPRAKAAGRFEGRRGMVLISGRMNLRLDRATAWETLDRLALVVGYSPNTGAIIFYLSKLGFW